MVLAYVCVAITENLGILELGVASTTIIGLVLGEVSKALNSATKKEIY